MSELEKLKAGIIYCYDEEEDGTLKDNAKCKAKGIMTLTLWIRKNSKRP